MSRRRDRTRPSPALVVLAGGLLFWAGRLQVLSGAVERSRAWWAEPREVRPTTDPVGLPLALAVLGDSAAQGVGASSPHRAWPGRLARRLADGSGRTATVHNLSVSGARLADVTGEQLPRLRALLRTVQPDLVLVAAGGNDVRDGVGAYGEGVTALLDGLVAAVPAGRLVVADVPFFGHGHYERDAARASELVQERARERGVVVAPLHARMSEAGWWGMWVDYAADWFHPNDRGHALWADAFLATAPVAAVAAPVRAAAARRDG